MISKTITDHAKSQDFYLKAAAPDMFTSGEVFFHRLSYCSTDLYKLGPEAQEDCYSII